MIIEIYQEQGYLDIPEIGNIKSWITKLELKNDWYGWNILKNFIRIRHCFAHEYDHVTKKQEDELSSFLFSLSSLRDENGELIPKYYNVKSDKTIELNDKTLIVFRKIIIGILNQLDDKKYTTFDSRGES